MGKVLRMLYFLLEKSTSHEISIQNNKRDLRAKEEEEVVFHMSKGATYVKPASAVGLCSVV